MKHGRMKIRPLCKIVLFTHYITLINAPGSAFESI